MWNNSKTNVIRLCWKLGIAIFALQVVIGVAFGEEILTLEKSINLALANNELIKIAQKKLVVAKGGKQEAFGHFLPQLTASASFTRLSEVPALGMETMLLEPEGGVGSLVRFYGYETFSYKMGEEENYLTKLTLTQPLFTWGKIYQGYRQARLNYKLAEESYCQIRSELILDVRKSFYSILLAKEFVAIAQEAMDVVEHHLKVTKALYREGKVSGYDVSRVKVQLVNAQTKLIKAKNGLRLARKALLNLINYPPAKDWEIPGELKFKPEEIDLDDSLRKALSQRSELKQTAIQEKIGESLIKLAKAQNRPSVTLVGNYEYKKPFYFENRWDDSWNVTATLTFPFFTGFSNWGKIKQAKAELGQLRARKRFLEEGIKMEVEKAFLDLEEARERIEAQEANVETARDNLKIAEERHRQGLMSEIELRDAQLSLTQAETDYFQALYDYNVAGAFLNRAIGKYQ